MATIQITNNTGCLQTITGYGRVPPGQTISVLDAVAWQLERAGGWTLVSPPAPNPQPVFPAHEPDPEPAAPADEPEPDPEAAAPAAGEEE
ncbi:MAG: hypothetical protein KQJ78_20550 [Deltaproteobacteria bacterium]|nr:hypothetical protein [Deltaproteobacteria bacterium]